MSSAIEQEIETFNSCLKSEKNLTVVVQKLKEIASHFLLLEEENSLNGTFVTLLNLAEAFNHELLIGYKDSINVLRHGGLSTT